LRYSIIYLLIMLALAGISYAQELPSSIRGNKVHKVKVHVGSIGDERGDGKNAAVKIGQPRLVGIDLAGVTLEGTAEGSEWRG